VNLAVSGARAHDVAGQQVAQAAVNKPDVVLVAVGANDVTHLTSIGSVRASLQTIIVTLRQANPQVRILFTGSPDMGAVPRIPQPLRALAGNRTKALNSMMSVLAAKEHVTFVPIAEKTGPIFRAHHELFAPDNFHPNTEGYKTWIPVIVAAIDEALAQ
jgi:lysophospholipase L1-like esterase